MFSGAPGPVYEGLVASRNRMMVSHSTVQKQMMFRSAFIPTENLTVFRIALSAFYNAGKVGGNQADTGIGAATTITASIEYPSGTCTQLKFSASASSTIPDGGVVFTDSLTISIPSGSTAWLRGYWVNSAGIVYNNFQNTTLGEVVRAAASGVSDQTMSCDAITNNLTASVPPLAVLGMTTKPSVIIIGDSVSAGQYDTETSSGASAYDGKIGTIARSLGNIPFVNLSVGGEWALNWVANGTGRNQVVQFGSHMISDLGRNDIFNSRTVAQTLAAIGTVFALARSNQKKYQTTLLPNTSSSDGWLTQENQSPFNVGPNISLITLNNSLVAGVPNTNGTYDIATVMTGPGGNPGFWNSWVTAGSPPYCEDGIHPNTAGYIAIQNSGVINAITWP